MKMNRCYFLLVIIAFTNLKNAKAQYAYEVLSDVQLISDGDGGTDTYPLIESVFGAGSIEAPDLYSVNHPEVKHIVENTDSVMGNHFVFKIHKNEDWDRDTGKTDRQRNEIKTYAPSANTLKGFKGETMRFHWYFKLQEGFSISKNFSHFFQMKAVDGDDSQPIVTISGSINSNNPEFEIIYNKGDGASDQQLTHTNWNLANTGNWMEMEAIATFDDNGYLKIIVSDLTGKVLMQVERENIDMWRTGSTFARPKWGIYRSLSSKSYLSNEEETAGFASFSVQKIAFAEQTKVEDKADPKPALQVIQNNSNENITIKMHNAYSGKIKIIDAFGRLVLSQNVENSTICNIQVSQLAAGVFLIGAENTGKYVRWEKK